MLLVWCLWQLPGFFCVSGYILCKPYIENINRKLLPSAIVFCPWVTVSAQALVLLPWKGRSHFDSSLGSLVALPDFTVRKWQSLLCFHAIKAYWDGSPCFSWEKTVMLIRGGGMVCVSALQGVVWQQGGSGLRLSPTQEFQHLKAWFLGGVGVIAVLFVLVWGTIPGEMWVFFLGACKANSETSGIALKMTELEFWLPVLESWVQPALEFFRLVAEIWGSDRDWIPLASCLQWLL